MKLFNIFSKKANKVEEPKKVIHNREYLEGEMHKADQDRSAYDKKYKESVKEYLQLVNQKSDEKTIYAARMDCYAMMYQWQAANKIYWDLKNMLD